LLPISQKKLQQPQWVTEEWAAWEEWTSKKVSYSTVCFSFRQAVEYKLVVSRYHILL